MRLRKLLLPVMSMLSFGVASGSAHADIRVGVDLSTTGPAAAIGIPSRNTVQMWPQTLGG
ncbi:MAG TPA: branched-chain amino acid ABC transporter substrate-binding protein, partial [Cupriavidus sp.]|nr:branched-chain amino acid ABC transporter substrate-binding protein [Cupriavidus sp.]